MAKGDNLQGQQLSISLDQLENVKCKKCQGIYFQTIVQLKVIPKVVDPNLMDDVIKPILGYRCVACGEILEQE